MQTFGWPEAYFILRAASWTLALTAIAFFIGSIIGGIFAIMRLSRVKALRRFAAGYILVIQSIPVLMVLFMSYYGLSAIGIELPPFFAASASLSIYVSAYLAEMGHRVVEAADGATAIDILRADDQLDLLIADFAMPGMTGTELADKARAIRPGVGVLLVTGYADPARMPDNYLLLNKPFSRGDLAAKVIEAAPAEQSEASTPA